MAVALISLLVACIIVISSKLDSSYQLLHKRSIKPKKKSQKFRFKSLFWAVISTLVLVTMIVVALDVNDISKFGTTWSSTALSIYIILIVVLVMSLLVCGVISTAIVLRAKRRGYLISLPMFFLCSFTRRQTSNQYRENAKIVYHLIGSFAILFTSFVVSIHGTGIVIAALANPLQVISTVATGVVALFYLTYAFADVYDHCEDMFDVSPLPNCRSQVLFFILRLLTHVLVLLFYVLFSYMYISDVIFISGGNSVVISSIANVLPIILLTFFIWLSKNELQKFVKFESSDSYNDTTENLEIATEEQTQQAFHETSV